MQRGTEDADAVKLSLGVDALIPEHYIEDDAERFAFYQRFSRLTNQQELDEVIKELIDRFGSLPEEVDNLCHITAIRALTIGLGFKGVAFDDAARLLRIILPDEEQHEYYQQFFPKILDSFKIVGESRVRLQSEGKKLRLLIKLQSKERNVERLKEIEGLLQTLYSATHEGAVPSAI